MKKQLLLVMALMLTAATSLAQTLNIGGHRAPLDTLNHRWLCSVPQSMFGQDFTATVDFGDELGFVYIEDELVNNGDEVTFEMVEGGKEYAVTVQLGDSLYSGAITFTWLPLVELFGNITRDYIYTEMYISEPDSTNAELMKAKIKTRGIATDADGEHKRNYSIMFINEDSTKCNRRFFGLRNDNSWILDAGQMDFLRVRNRVSTDLWLDMARRPWYSDTLPNARNGSRGQMVEVMLNGEYRGIYNMCEPIDRKQLKLKRYEESSETIHGDLWMAARWSRTVTMVVPSPRRTAISWDGFNLKYPEYDKVHRNDWTPLEDAVWFAKRGDTDLALLSDSVGYYFDVPVMQDYFIFIAALQALDNESKNIFYGIYDIQDHPRLTMAPWDLDICLGQNYAPGVNLPNMVRPDRELDWIYHVPMSHMWQSYEYHNEVVARYKELREGVLNTENMVNRYRSAIENLENCGAAAREEARWSGDTDLAGKTLDLNAEMDYVENWIRQRMPFLDSIMVEMPEPPEPPEPQPLKGDVNGDGEVNIADINALIDIILGGYADEATLKRADVNEDAEINIADINALIDIILG